MNLKKTALLIILCTATFPVMGNARPSQNSHVAMAAKHGPISSFFIHVLTLGHKSHPQG